MTDTRSSATILAGPRRRAIVPILVVGAAMAWCLAALPFTGALARPLALALYALTALLVIDGLGSHHPYERFGGGNAITLLRAGGACVFAALAIEPEVLAGTAAWWALAAVGAFFALDGLDGLVARRQGQVSAFGARFDMEVDALLILALAVLAAGLDKAGPWVIGLGLLRYAFVLAGWLAPPLARPLPASQRRRVVCGLQIAVLGLLLAPPVWPPASTLLAAAAFAALVWSFAVDVARLVRTR